MGIKTGCFHRVNDIALKNDQRVTEFYRYAKTGVNELPHA
jgi:hypothetical protein